MDHLSLRRTGRKAALAVRLNRQLSSTGLACIDPQPAPSVRRGTTEECPMARSLARDAEDFARLMLHTVERLGHDGGWVRAADALEQTLADHPDHLYVAQLKAKPTRRIGLSAAAERIRAAEFPHLERRQAGARRNAPLFYRIARPGAALDLRLPYEVAPSHPLLVQRRGAGAEPVCARRAALTEGPPTSPWRRRLLLRPTHACADQPASWSPRLLWTRVCGLVSVFAAAVTGR
jgi:hypothetical protein